MNNRAVFLDRDGTLNEDRPDYIKNLAEYQLFPFTLAALRRLRELGFKLIVITNQAAIARKLTTTAEVEQIHAWLIQQTRQAGAGLDAIYYCPHHPDDHCDCRKPAIGHLRRAIADFAVDVRRSFFIGDSLKDIEAGARAGCRTILVCSGYRQYDESEIRQQPFRPDQVCADLAAAADWIAGLPNLEERR